jgi:hypothetical protein
MPGESSTVEEFGQRTLQGQIGVPVHQLLGDVDGRLQGGWSDDEAQPENRRQRLGEAADIDHRLLMVESVERDYARVVVEIAVIVVLEYRGAVSLGPFEQFQATTHRHRHAHWELVCGRDVDQPDLLG